MKKMGTHLGSGSSNAGKYKDCEQFLMISLLYDFHS